MIGLIAAPARSTALGDSCQWSTSPSHFARCGPTADRQHASDWQSRDATAVPSAWPRQSRPRPKSRPRMEFSKQRLRESSYPTWQIPWTGATATNISRYTWLKWHCRFAHAATLGRYGSRSTWLGATSAISRSSVGSSSGHTDDD